MIEKLKSKISLNIKGKNINRFIQKITNKKIDILSLNYINKNEANILIYKKDYEKLLKVKTIYEILEIDSMGYIKIKKNIQLNKHLIICTVISFIILLTLTNTIFDIQVVHSNKEIRELIKKELSENGIKKYHFKKNFNQIAKIKEKILNKYPDQLEWLEIEQKGTKYVVRVEERIITKNNTDTTKRSIVAKKDAVIKKVISSKGNIEVETNAYVKKGDTIINGSIMLNEKEMGKVKAEGKAYGEVWYVIKTEYPFIYTEEKETGKRKRIYAIKILNKIIELTKNKYKTKKIEETPIIQNNILPIKLVKQNQRETKIKSQILTFDEALIKAKQHSIKKMTQKLKEDEYIIRSKYLKSKIKENVIEIEMFFSIYENITAYQEIKW